MGTTGPLLGPATPHEGEETGLSLRSLHCDWAYKPGGEGVAIKQAKESKGNVRRETTRRAQQKKVKKIRE